MISRKSAGRSGWGRSGTGCRAMVSRLASLLALRPLSTQWVPISTTRGGSSRGLEAAHCKPALVQRRLMWVACAAIPGELSADLSYC